MASEVSENPALPIPRLSPGDAAFERLKRREALKAQDGPVEADTAPEPVKPEARQDTPEAPVEATTPPVAAATAEGEAATAPQAPDVPAVAISAPTSPAEAPGTVIAAPIAEPPAAPAASGDDRDDRIIAVAAALGIETVTTPVKEAANAGRAADAAAEKLEAALLDQLKSLEEVLATPPAMPKAMPLRPPQLSPEPEDPVGPPRRSVFAPDPVRQRTYVDLRNPAPEPDMLEQGDPPWRKYLEGPASTARPARAGRPVRRGGETRPSATVAAIFANKAEAEERGRGVRALSAAAVLGLGVGLGLVVLLRPFAETQVSSAPTPVTITAESVAATAPAMTVGGQRVTPTAAGPQDAVGQALATLLAESTVSRPLPEGPAVISEPDAPAEAVAATAVGPSPAAAPRRPVVVIRPSAEDQREIARVPDFDAAAGGPLAYAPSIPSYDPVRQSLLAEQDSAGEASDPPPARTAARATADAPPAASRPRAGRATINTFVNLRAKPDNNAAVVAILADGLSVRVIGCDYWCEVEAGGKRGFVYKKFVSR